MEMEKTITRCLCKVLEGLSLNNTLELPDAVVTLEKKAAEKEAKEASGNKGKGKGKRVNELTSMLEELVKEIGEDDDGVGLGSDDESEK
jgi:hypothetical protein